MAGKTERTFIAVKPDGVQRGLMGEIIKRFEQKGFRLVAAKFVQIPAVLFCRNLIHGSDSEKSAATEVSLWFKPEELVSYRSCAQEWIYE